MYFFRPPLYVYAKLRKYLNKFPIPLKARITRIWRDPAGNMMFRGPVYLWPGETAHEPVRNFHFKEVILSANENKYPLSAIRGRCSVLVKPDYQSCRPVNITENHVYFQESKYTEVMENGITQGKVKILVF